RARRVIGSVIISIPQRGIDSPPERCPCVSEYVERLFAFGRDAVVLTWRAGAGLLPVGAYPACPTQSGEQGIQRAFPTREKTVFGQAAGDIPTVGGLLPQRCKHAILHDASS